MCPQCGHLQLQDMDADFIAELYTGEAFNVENPAGNVARLEMARAELGEALTSTPVLEVGGGRNGFAAQLTGESPETWSCDFSLNADVIASVDHAIAGDFLTVDLPTSHFGLLALFHVMEHFPDPLAAAQRIAALLRPGGHVLVEVPNLAWLCANAPYYALLHQHLSLFRSETLSQLMARAGLRLRRILRHDEVLYHLYELAPGAPVTPQPTLGLQEAERLVAALARLPEALAALPLHADATRNAIYGAGGSTALLLAHAPALAARLGVCFDRDARKQGRRLPGSGLPIAAPEQMFAQPPAVLLFLSSSLCARVGTPANTVKIDLEPLLTALDATPS
ncbi:putative methyltransferase [Magnetofaba australis IT-1]|uniref:Putative methyltransferase n=1 Tax=Magnetofaba australis IT-1 TaxID=1434232 RepID=A0A1Y2K4B9_9PROT|nr:putative methyltransferase [Magnetofaba australis IT-1]